MTSTKLQDYEACIEEARTNLSMAAELIGKEMKDYPTPVAGCDEQFNRLLEERGRIRNALSALDERATS